MPTKRAFINRKFACSGTSSQEWLDVQHLSFAAAGEPRHDHAHQRHVGEHRNGDAEHHGDGEAANRAGAEQEQKRMVAVSVVTLASAMVAKAFALWKPLVERRHRAEDPLRASLSRMRFVDENIRIDRDADAENNACDTGQRQRCADQA